MENSLTLPEEQIEALKKGTPVEFIDKRKGASGMVLSYVDIGYVTSMLNKIFGHVWTFEIKSSQVIEDQVIVQGCLKVMLKDGTVLTKEQFGSSNIKRAKTTKQPLSVGDDFKSASSDALKKCASMLGLASDVYFPRLHQKVQAIKAEQGKASDNPELSKELDSIPE